MLIRISIVPRVSNSRAVFYTVSHIHPAHVVKAKVLLGNKQKCRFRKRRTLTHSKNPHIRTSNFRHQAERVLIILGSFSQLVQAVRMELLIIRFLLFKGCGGVTIGRNIAILGYLDFESSMLRRADYFSFEIIN